MISLDQKATYDSSKTNDINLYLNEIKIKSQGKWIEYG